MFRRAAHLVLVVAFCAGCGDDTATQIQDPDPRPEFVLAWGEQGTGPGQFDLPYDVAVSPDGSVFVADGRNRRIQAFDSDGTFLRAWLTQDNHRGIDGPSRLDVGPQGHVFVDAGPIVKYTAAGDFVDMFPPGDDFSRFGAVADLAVDADGFVYVASWDSIYKLDGSGDVVLRWGGSGSAPGQLQLPSAVDVGADGNVVVGDRNNQRVQVFTPEGVFVRAWDLTADSGVLSDITTAPSGRTYVVHVRSGIVGRHAPDGALELTFGGRGDGPGEFRNPAGFAVDASGHLFVADTGNHRVQKLAVGR